MFKKIILATLLSISIVFAAGEKPVIDEKSTMPYSKQATIIDTTSTSEVLLEATGIYYSDYKNEKARQKDIIQYGIQEASIDAKKAAIYSLLFSGTDPILSTLEEQRTFDRIKEDFFIIENLDRFIVYEDALPKQKITLNNTEGIKIVKQIKVNRDSLIQNLEQNNIIQSRQELSQLIGTPFIMVMPQLQGEETIVDALQKNDTNKHAAGVIQGALTQKKYDVILPDQQEKLNQFAANQLNNSNKDAAYELALSLGSDVYIDFNISSSESEYETKKYAATLRAFETSTARLLGSETGHSKARRGDDFVSIEEAILQSLGNLLNRVSNYWKSDVTKGLQYKTIISISPNSFKVDELESIQDGIIDSIESISNESKEMVITNYTIDYLMWVNPEEFNSARKVYRKLKSTYKSTNLPGKLAITNQNRKLLQITVK